MPENNRAQNVDRFAGAVDMLKRNIPWEGAILIPGESISSVAIHKENLARIAGFLSPYFSSTRIILYVREILYYSCSRIQQSLNSAYPLTEHVFNNAIKEADNTVFLSNLRETFDHYNVSIRSFDPEISTDWNIVPNLSLGAIALPDMPLFR